MTTCDVPDCTDNPRNRGLCGRHYNSARLSGELPLLTPLDRLWAKIKKTDECWLWTAAITTDPVTGGYGRVWWDNHVQQVHRVVYELLIGPIPINMELDHTCHKPEFCPGGGTCPHRRCVNPQHLEPVPARINLIRGSGVPGNNHRKTHCDSGHEFTPENTYVWRSERHCKECRRVTESNRVRERPPLQVITRPCVICQQPFTYTRGRGQAPNVCSEFCRTERKRRVSKEFARQKRAAKYLN